MAYRLIGSTGIATSLHELHLILGTSKQTIINLQQTPTTPKSFSTLFEYAQLEPQHRNSTRTSIIDTAMKLCTKNLRITQVLEEQS